jgi:hypothetical protein
MYAFFFLTCIFRHAKIYKLVDMDPFNTESLLYANAEPKISINLPGCKMMASSIKYAVDIAGPHLDGTLTLKFANQRDLNIMLDIFNKSRAYFAAAQEAFKNLKYVAAGGKAADILAEEFVKPSDIHGVGLTLDKSRNGKSITVSGIAPGSPAALCDAVISIHDHLLKVDDVDVKHSCLTLKDVANLVLGLRGSCVKLLFRRSRDLEGNPQARAKSVYEVILKRGTPVDSENSLTATSPVENSEMESGEFGGKADTLNADSISHSNGGQRSADSLKPHVFSLSKQAVQALASQTNNERADAELRTTAGDRFRTHSPAFPTSGSKTCGNEGSDCARVSPSDLSSGPTHGWTWASASSYKSTIESVGARQCALPPKRAIDYDIKQLADDTSMEVYPTDIGVMLCADRGGHAVHSVLPSAPPSVLNCVCVKDVLVSINGEAVANASRDTVTAMLQHSSALSFLCDSLLYFVRILLQSQIQKPIFI